MIYSMYTFIALIFFSTTYTPVESSLKSYFGTSFENRPGSSLESPLGRTLFTSKESPATGNITGRDLTTDDVLTLLSSLGRPDSYRQLRLIYDENRKDITDNIPKHISDKVSGIMLHRYVGSDGVLTPILRQDQDPTLLLVLCTAPNILGIFSKIKSQYLKSHYVHWLLILEQDDSIMEGFTSMLEDLIFEGTKVSLVVKSFTGDYVLSTAEVNVQGTIQFIRKGEWDKMTLTTHNPVLTILRSVNTDHLYSNMAGRQLTSCALEYWPFYVKGDQLPDGSYEVTGGYEVTVMKALSESLNFTYRVVAPEDKQWGNLQPDGSVTGMIGEVARREVHFANVGFAISDKRNLVVDYSTPYFSDSFTSFSNAPMQKSRALAIISPFSLQVWIYIIVSTLCIGPTLSIVSKLSLKEEKWDLQVYSFNSFRSLLIQGNLLDINDWPRRFTFFFWYLFCLTVSASYSGMLTAVLTIPSFETPINYLSEIQRAVRNGYGVGIVQGTIVNYVLEEAKDGVYKEVWESLNYNDQSESFLDDDIIGMEKILEGKYIYIGPIATARALAIQLGSRHFHQGIEEFNPIFLAMAMPPGAPYRPAFNHVLDRLTEGGLIRRWLKEEFDRAPKREPTVVEEVSKTSAFSLSQLQASFIMLGIGACITTIVLVIERLIGPKLE